MHRRALIASVLGLAAAPTLPYGVQGGMTRDEGFAAWLAGFRGRAVARGLGPAGVEAALAGLSPDPRVLALDSRQPEFSKPVGDYISTLASETRAALGRAKLDAVAPRLGAATAVAPPEILGAIWGVESGFGASMGDFDVVRSLATQAAQGRRGPWAESQLVAALKILERGEADRARLKGSWAGAMGQTQFTPEDYLSFAVDGDGDGRRDIWGSPVDALASTANFLVKKAAWRAGQSWAREVVVPSDGSFDYARVEVQPLLPEDWRRVGVKTADGAGFRPDDKGVPAALILPMGWRGPGFLVFPNHMAIRAYNNSTSYALAVGLLADRMAGRGGLVQPWPMDAPTSLAERIGAQQALVKLGFDPGGVDGVIGTGTRKAARAWQAWRKLPADGYLSADLLRRLRAEAGIDASLTPAGPRPAT